jgi:putative membrane protein
MQPEGASKSLEVVWIAVFAIVLVWSGIEPKDTVTWMLEVAPAVAGAAILLATRKRFPLTRLAYVFRDLFDPPRNNYDKLGHLAQGFIPAIIAREVVIRLEVFKSSAWRNFFIVCFCLAVSAFYELIEWWVALLSDEAADAFLGMQGYVWDTQSDMFLALVGAVLALVLLGRAHDWQLAEFAD